MYIPIRDALGNVYEKHLIAEPEMHYEPRALDFVTSKYNSLYNRKHDTATISGGTDYGDAVLRFFDSSDSELSYQQAGYESETEAQFQTRLDSNCIKTQVDFTPSFKFAIRSGILMLREEWTYDGYIWCLLAPHISEEYGGSVPFMSGGYNLQYFPAKSYIRMDGSTTFVIEVDDTYYSNRIGLVLKHSLGDNKGIQMIYELYK